MESRLRRGQGAEQTIAESLGKEGPAPERGSRFENSEACGQPTLSVSSSLPLSLPLSLPPSLPLSFSSHLLLIAFASASLCPSASVFLTISLPAKSHTLSFPTVVTPSLTDVRVRAATRWEREEREFMAWEPVARFLEATSRQERRDLGEVTSF